MARQEWLSEEWFIVNYQHLCRTFQTELTDTNDSTKINISAGAGTKYYLVNPLKTNATQSGSFVVEYTDPNYGTCSLAGWRLSFEPEIMSIDAGEWIIHTYILVEGGTPNNTLYLKCRLYKSSEPFPRESQCTQIGEGQAEITATGALNVSINAGAFDLNNEYLFLVCNITTTDASTTDSITFRCENSGVYVQYPATVPDTQMTNVEISVAHILESSNIPVEISSVSVEAIPILDSSEVEVPVTSGEVDLVPSLDFSHYEVTVTDNEISVVPTLVYGDVLAPVQDVSINTIPSPEVSQYVIAFTNIALGCAPTLTYTKLTVLQDSYAITVTPAPEFEEWSLPVIVTNGEQIDNRTVERGGFYKRR